MKLNIWQLKYLLETSDDEERCEYVSSRKAHTRLAEDGHVRNMLFPHGKMTCSDRHKN